MGKVRKVQLGDEKYEKAQAKKAEARREAKKFKKEKVKGVGLHGGERTAVVEGTELKGDVKEILKEVEEGKTAADAKAIAGKEKKAAAPKVRGKQYQEMTKRVDKTKLYSLKDAIALVKETSFTKFDGTVELHINLNPQMLGGKTDMRGSVSLPHGTGKQVRVAIADEALIKEIEAGTISFDILVAHPSMMPKLAKVARTLGPKGLMPNPKTGTVVDDPEKRAKELSHGQVNFKTEPEQPIIHMSVGKVSFPEKDLIENIQAVVTAIGKSKIAKATIAATMGPGIKISLS